MSSATRRACPVRRSPTWRVAGLPSTNITTVDSSTHLWYPTGAISGRITDGLPPSASKRQRRWVESASTRIVEMPDPSGRGVAEYSLSGALWVTRVTRAVAKS